MPLRADAPEFIPKAVARGNGMRVSRGDQLIQDLARAMEPQKTNILSCKFPVAGVFCPYCVAGAGCAFHKAATTSEGTEEVLNGRCHSLGSTPGVSQPPTQLTLDSEEASTDVGSSDGWCEASDLDGSDSPVARGGDPKNTWALRSDEASPPARATHTIGRIIKG